MATSSQERVLKKKLENFLQELQHFGTVKGFRHFHCYVRSKEELLIVVNNRSQGHRLSFSSLASTPSSRKPSLGPNDRSSVSSHNTQVGRDPMRDDVCLPPASPSEDSTPDPDVTVLLIAGYARYSCPYVWVRTNHQRLLQLSNRVDVARDTPLRLASTTSWREGDVHVTDIVAEVVGLCTHPAPWNPFDIDLQYFQSLSQPDQFLGSAAMMACLQKIVIHTSESKPYSAKVFDDLQHITQFHFTNLRKMVEATDIPILQKNSPQRHQEHPHRHQTDQQCHQHSQQHQQTHSVRARYPRVTAAAPMPLLQSPGTASPSDTFSTSRVIYGQGFDGSFPGGFNRTPAPSLI
ncbi:hypothetical protein BsWGS_03531 [Bradybaena similaris]